MKKNLFYFIMLLVFAAMPFTSCEKDPQRTEEEQPHDPQSDEDQIEISGYDGLEWFQNSIVVLDENGKPERRIYGQILDPSDTTILSVCVSDLEMAKKIFLSWVAPGKEASSDGDDYNYNLTDRDGKPQGSVSFRKDGKDGILATVTVGPDTDLKCFTQINFVSEQAWDENDAVELYEAGNTYSRETTVFEWVFASYENDFLGIYNKENKDFYCIQGNGNGKEAILVWLSPDTNMDEYHPTPSGYIKRELYKQLPTEPKAQKVLDFYNENQDAWNKMLAEMDKSGHEWSPQSGGETTGNSEFLLNSYNKDTNRIKCLDLDGDTGKIINVRGWSWYKYRYMQILIFPPHI